MITNLGAAVARYMAEDMAMPNSDSDQEQNWIAGHMMTFASRLLLMEAAPSVPAGATPPAKGATESPHESSSEIVRLRSLLQTTEAARDEALNELAHARDMRNAVTSMDYLTTCLAVDRDALKAKLNAAETRLSSLTQAHARLIEKWRDENGCDSDLRTCRQNWPDFNASWCAGCHIAQCAADLAAVAETTEATPPSPS